MWGCIVNLSLVLITELTRCPSPMSSVTQEEISPLENAIETMELTNERISNCVQQHAWDRSLSVHPLSMLLSGIVDPAVMGGYSNYEKVCWVLGPHRTLQPPSVPKSAGSFLSCHISGKLSLSHVIEWTNERKNCPRSYSS